MLRKGNIYPLLVGVKPEADTTDVKSAWVIKMLEMYLLYTTLKHRPKR